MTINFTIEDKASNLRVGREYGLSKYSFPRHIWLRGYDENGHRVYSESIGVYDAKGRETGDCGKKEQLLEAAEKRKSKVAQALSQ